MTALHVVILYGMYISQRCGRKCMMSSNQCLLTWYSYKQLVYDTTLLKNKKNYKNYNNKITQQVVPEIITHSMLGVK